MEKQYERTGRERSILWELITSTLAIGKEATTKPKGASRG
jgi:hypothetical protein